MDANDFNGIAPLDQTALRKLRNPTFLLGVVSRKSIALPLSLRITYDSKKLPMLHVHLPSGISFISKKQTKPIKIYEIL